MASTALEEKINKIRLRNEEIKRRYEEVEADKKNAAKLDALVEPAPSEDWPERKEPPEFSAPASKHTNRPKHPVKKHNDQSTQYYTGSGDGKKAHNFGDGQGPPPDPKYNFLADSERDEHGEETPRDTERNRGRGKPTRGIFKRRGSGRDWHSKEQWNQQGSPGDATRPDYEAWRAERNRIDEARISRQRTAEGNWRREWDNDKVHLADEVTRRDRVTLGDVATTRQEHSDNEKHLYRSPRTAPRNSQHANSRDSYHGAAAGPEAANKLHGSTINEPEKRVVIATDRNIKVLLNPGSTPPKSSVMSVKVSQPNIAGTGRVGPRQRPRVMYSSQSEAEASEAGPALTRQKSVDERTAARAFEQKGVSPKSPHPQRKRDADPKSPYSKRRDNNDRGDKESKSGKKDAAQKSPYPQRRGNAAGNYPPKSPRVNRRSTETGKNDFTKSPRAPQERSRVKRNASSVSEESKGESSDGDVLVDKSTNELPSHVDSDAKTNDENVPTKESPPGEAVEENRKSGENSTEDSAKNDDEPAERSSELSKMSTEEIVRENNAGDNKTIQTPSETAPMNESPENIEPEKNRTVDETKTDDDKFSDHVSLESSINPVEEIPDAADNKTPESKESHEEAASGSRESKDIDAGTASNREVINCSSNANNALNDSGFLEQPSNDSIHDISGNSNAATSDFAETSVDSIQSENEPVENNRAIEENREETPKVADENPTESSTGSLENKEENSATDELEVVEKISQPEEADLPENSTNLEVKKLESQDKEEIVAREGPGNISNLSKSEDKNLATGEEATEAMNAQEIENESKDESKIISENSNNAEEITHSDEKNKDSQGEYASVSRSPNDINKENNVESATAKSLSSTVVEKADENSN